MAAMQLAEQGKMDIDKPVQTYLPEFQIKSRFPESVSITPSAIMTHHSGLPSGMLHGMFSKKPEPMETMLGRLKDTYTSFPPHYVFSYSNLGVAVLGHAMEKVAKRDFAGHLNAVLLQPLGMADSSFAQGIGTSPKAAKAYLKGKLVEECFLWDVPAGGLNTTVRDLSRFMEMVFADGCAGERQIIQPHTLAEMLRAQNTDVPLDLNFHIGLGRMLGSAELENAGVVAHHGGATLYHRAYLMILPEHKLGVVAMANSATTPITEIANEAMSLALEAKTGIKQPKQKQTPQSTTLPAEETLQGYEGYYATQAGLVSVSNTSGQLTAKVMDTTMRLVHRGQGEFGLQYKMLGLFPMSLGELDKMSFSRVIVAGREIVKARIGKQEMLFGEKIAPIVLPEAWRQRVGEYEIMNRGDDAMQLDNIRVKEEDGLLVLNVSTPLFPDEPPMNDALKPISNTEAIIYGLGRGMGETIRVVPINGGEALEYSGYLLRKKSD